MVSAETTDLHDVVLQYLENTKLLQLATSNDNLPWVVTVLFVHDDQANLYWLSEPSRHHSQDIAQNPRAAVAMAIKTDLPVIGLQAYGRAEVVTDLALIKVIVERYTAKHGLGQDFYSRAVDGSAKHKLYVFKPESYRLFDELNYPESSPLDWSLLP